MGFRVALVMLTMRREQRCLTVVARRAADNPTFGRS